MNALVRPRNRYVATLIAAVLFAVAASLRGTPESHPAVMAAAPGPTAAAMAPVRLPEIVVRASPEERAEALAATMAAAPAEVASSPFLRPGDDRSGGGGGYVSSPRMNFDMPYYAFGKVLPRAASRD